MRKLTCILFLLFFINRLNAQKVLPPYEHNITSKDSAEIKTLLFASKYFSFSIVLKREGVWFNKNYKMIGYKDTNWYQIRILNERETGVPKKSDFVFFKEETELCNSILTELKTNFLFSMDVDSLNIDELLVYDSSSNEYQWSSKYISDGIYNSFYIISKDKVRKVSNYAPEAYLEYLPHITQRKYFINCKNSFLRLNKE